MKLLKYNAGGLRTWMDSEAYRQMPFIPVTRHRADSWLQNPRLDPDDILLYLLCEGEEMLAYRCILPDRFGRERFGWLSGIWVRPDQRNKGLASGLLEEAAGDWKGRLMLNNYAPASAALALKTGLFTEYARRRGLRYYFRAATALLLGNRRRLYRRSRLFLQLGDALINGYMEGRRRRVLHRLNDASADREEVPLVDTQASALLQASGASGCCGRGLEEMNWILRYPWVRPGRKDQRYAFSSYARKFENRLIKVYGAGEELTGFFWIKQHGSALSIPYTAWMPSLSGGMSALLNQYILQSGAAWLTCFNPGILAHYRPEAILGRRAMSQHYLVTHAFRKLLPDPAEVYFQDGDGDLVFT